MNLLILGRGKTGALVAEVARECKHDVRVLGADENLHAAGLTPDKLRGIDVVIDFTTPPVVVENIGACVIARKNMVVGTTGWYDRLPEVAILAIDAAARLLPQGRGSGFAPSLLELSRMAGNYDRLMEVCRQRGIASVCSPNRSNVPPRKSLTAPRASRTMRLPAAVSHGRSFHSQNASRRPHAT
jgi:hypothetical protein